MEGVWVGGDWEVFLCVVLHLHQRIFSVVQILCGFYLQQSLVQLLQFRTIVSAVTL
jgi:hypothetical protein